MILMAFHWVEESIATTCWLVLTRDLCWIFHHYNICLGSSILVVYRTSRIIWASCNMGYSSETYLKLKSAVLCAKFQSDFETEKWIMDKRGCTIFVFKMLFGRISYIAQQPCTIVVRSSKTTIHMYEQHFSQSEYQHFNKYLIECCLFLLLIVS